MSYDILSKNFEMLLYDGIQYLDQSNVSQFTQKIPLYAKAIGLILAKIIQPYDSPSENFFEILWHNGAQYIDKSNVSQFSKKNLLLENMGPIWPKITQLVLTAPEIFRNILA